MTDADRSDEETGGEQARPDRSRERARRPRDEGSESSGGLRFWLPPIKLPSTAFPRDLRVSLPPPGYVHRSGLSVRSVVVVALAFDVLDAGLALAGVGPVLDWTRVVVGLGLAAALTGIYGSLYAWEAVALALGVGWATAIPSVTALLLVRGRRE